MKVPLKHLLLFVPASFLICVSGYALQPEIKLVGRKDLVLSRENRDTVLEVGQSFLSKPEDDFLVKIENIETPFSFEEEKVQVAADKNTGGSDDVKVPELIKYDDASVLAVSAANFAKQVRGALQRGDKSFLQLEGGSLLKPGTSFPVRLPQLKGQSFVLTLTEISSEGYTLQLGEATLQLNYDNSSSNPGSVEFTKP